MSLQQRRIFITLDLYTDAPLESLMDSERWLNLMRGKNPTWVEYGREAQIRIQNVIEHRPGFDAQEEELTNLRIELIGLQGQVDDLSAALKDTGAPKPSKPKKAPAKKKVQAPAGS